MSLTTSRRECRECRTAVRVTHSSGTYQVQIRQGRNWKGDGIWTTSEQRAREDMLRTFDRIHRAH